MTPSIEGIVDSQAVTGVLFSRVGIINVRHEDPARVLSFPNSS